MQAINELEAAEPGIDWRWHSTGHSLGGFLATTTVLYFPHVIVKTVSFDAPGFTTYYW